MLVQILMARRQLIGRSVGRHGARLMSHQRPGVALTAAAALFLVQATQSAVKPFLTGPTVGFMLLGNRLDGPAEMVAAWVHTILMLIVAYGIWRLRRYALWILIAYTPYVLLNLVLFTWRYEFPGLVFGVIYAAIALGVPGGTAYLLAARRHELS